MKTIAEMIKSAQQQQDASDPIAFVKKLAEEVQQQPIKELNAFLNNTETGQTREQVLYPLSLIYIALLGVADRGTPYSFNNRPLVINHFLFLHHALNSAIAQGLIAEEDVYKTFIFFMSTSAETGGLFGLLSMDDLNPYFNLLTLDTAPSRLQDLTVYQQCLSDLFHNTEERVKLIYTHCDGLNQNLAAFNASSPSNIFIHHTQLRVFHAQAMYLRLIENAFEQKFQDVNGTETHIEALKTELVKRKNTLTANLENLMSLSSSNKLFKQACEGSQTCLAGYPTSAAIDVLDLLNHALQADFTCILNEMSAHAKQPAVAASLRQATPAASPYSSSSTGAANAATQAKPHHTTNGFYIKPVDESDAVFPRTTNNPPSALSLSVIEAAEQTPEEIAEQLVRDQQQAEEALARYAAEPSASWLANRATSSPETAFAEEKGAPQLSPPMTPITPLSLLADIYGNSRDWDELKGLFTPDVKRVAYALLTITLSFSAFMVGASLPASVGTALGLAGTTVILSLGTGGIFALIALGVMMAAGVALYLSGAFSDKKPTEASHLPPMLAERRAQPIAAPTPVPAALHNALYLSETVSNENVNAVSGSLPVPEGTPPERIAEPTLFMFYAREIRGSASSHKPLSSPTPAASEENDVESNNSEAWIDSQFGAIPLPLKRRDSSATFSSFGISVSSGEGIPFDDDDASAQQTEWIDSMCGGALPLPRERRGSSATFYTVTSASSGGDHDITFDDDDPSPSPTSPSPTAPLRRRVSV